MSILEKNIECLLNLYSDSSEGLIIIDNDKNIIHINNSARLILGDFKNISEIEHCFNFDICILNEEEITTFNPLAAALKCQEDFKAETFYQIAQDNYKNLILKSLGMGKLKALIFADLTAKTENIALINEQKELMDRINELEEFSRLKEVAEAQAIRVGLINRISTSIRDTLDINEIIKTAIDEIARTLGVQRGVFASFSNNKFLIRNEWHINNDIKCMEQEIKFKNDPAIDDLFLNYQSQSSVCPDITDFLTNGNSENLKSRLATPVIYQGEILGIMLFYHANSKKVWHAEEINLVDGLSAQVAAAIYQASLFEQTSRQKEELEQALTELKQAQSQLIQSEKMASLGKLVAGVAHEINTPIGSLSSNIDMLVKFTKKLKDKMQNSQEHQSFLDILENLNEVNVEAIKRINTIIKSLKNFARLDEAELKEVDIHDGIRSTLMLVNHEIKDRIKITEEYGNIPHIECYPNLLNQVIMNILVNAYQSIEGNGEIRIKTELKDNKVLINISDTGKGISKENLPKIFDPGFTTKGVGVGTGLGLSICYQIIEKHHGIIKVESELDKGTGFIIELPLKQ